MDPSEGQDRLCLVRETKGMTRLADLQSDKRRKIECGNKHFVDTVGHDEKVRTDKSQTL
jgi:type III restriction enzyme